MIFLRKANERGHANHGWLDSWHTFSFADYYDPNYMGFSALRVINDDVIDAGQGFGTHPHKDMEILTYVLEGAVEHQDSMGNKEQVPAGEFQIMSAGTGVRHSEYNPSATDKLHLYQIWIIPEKTGITPRYEQRRFDARSAEVYALRERMRESPDLDAELQAAWAKANERLEQMPRLKNGSNGHSPRLHDNPRS